MNRQTAISRQEEIILKKKQELESRKKLELQQQFLDLQNNAANNTAAVKQECEIGNNKPFKSLASISRHKALLRSGLIGKRKTNIGSSSKASSSTINDCFEAAEDIKKEHFVKENSATDSCEEKSDSKSSPTVKDESQSTPAAGDVSWFQEAVERARQKALASGAVCPAASPASTNTKRTRWGDAGPAALPAPVNRPSQQGSGVLSLSVPSAVMSMVEDGQHLDAIKGVMLTRLTRYSPVIVSYARQVFGNTDALTEDQWKQCQDQIKMNVVFQLLQAKQVAAEKLAQKGQVKYEYDSDEDTDGGTWEHKKRKLEMSVTARKAGELTEMGAGKHHIGDFLPPEEMKKFMEKFCAIREGRDPDFSDYRNNKLTSDNIGYRMLQSMGWTEGQGLGPAGQGITQPVNQNGRSANHGLGVATPDLLTDEDNEYDAYRKRMMLSYRFRPNPMNNPRRPYY